MVVPETNLIKTNFPIINKVHLCAILEGVGI